jgi:hypothetical protein
MAVDNLPHVDNSSTESRTVTLGDLRDLVEAAALLPAEYIVRGNMIPFKMSDLGNRKGGCIMTIAIDRPERAD